MKKLKGVDAMFEALESDKRLLSFGEFFIACLLTGNAECVNLKIMFPGFYKKLKEWLDHHNEKILAAQLH